MKAEKARENEYGFSRTVNMTFDETTELTREALKTKGFGILSGIRLDEKLKEKLGVDFRRYVIQCSLCFGITTLMKKCNLISIAV